MTTLPNAVCVFCGASNDAPSEHIEAGRAFGQWMGENGVRLVYGGGDCGIMGSVANAVLKAKGRVTGVFPQSLKNIENEHAGLTEIVMVDTMHQRKELMYQRSDVFLIFPGGFGTMDEMFEILTWKQLMLHDKPIIIFNHLGYWDHLVALMDHIITERFAREEVRGFYQVVNTMDELKEALKLPAQR